MPVEALIFDLDGTLVDTAPDLLHATNHALQLIDRPPVTMAQLRTYVGQGAMNLIELGAKASGPAVDRETLLKLHAAFLDYYSDNIAVGSMMFEGLPELLKQARLSGLRLGVCTNKLERFSRKLLTELAVIDNFDAIVGGDTLPIMKPDPAPYREVARRLGVDVESTMMFGDSETDIRTAQNAGVPVVAVTFGYTTHHVSTFNPTHTIDHYDEAWDVVRNYL
jgi:phosphoglycolate phosphatase